MTILTSQTTVNKLPIEEIVTLYNLSWEEFKSIDAILDRRKGIKLSFLNGILEIMSPIGAEHERLKSTLGLLLETYMREKRIRFYRCGGFTLESPKKASGTPDESYAIGTQKEIPDLVIEVIITSGKLDKKELYRPQQVPEVWFWKKGEIIIFHLGEQGYQQRERSEFFPDLDISVLKKYVNYPDQYDAVNDLTNALRSGEFSNS